MVWNLQTGNNIFEISVFSFYKQDNPIIETLMICILKIAYYYNLNIYICITQTRQ